MLCIDAYLKEMPLISKEPDGRGAKFDDVLPRTGGREDFDKLGCASWTPEALSSLIVTTARKLTEPRTWAALSALARDLLKLGTVDGDEVDQIIAYPWRPSRADTSWAMSQFEKFAAASARVGSCVTSQHTYREKLKLANIENQMSLPERVQMLMSEAASAISETVRTVLDPFPDGLQWVILHKMITQAAINAGWDHHTVDKLVIAMIEPEKWSSVTAGPDCDVGEKLTVVDQDWIELGEEIG
jgi:hypothetical protein